jgi:hypothetical protein
MNNERLRGRTSSVIIGGVMLCGLMTIPHAYEPPTHARIAKQAVNHSVLGSDCSDLNSRCVPTDIGLRLLGNNPITDIQRFPNSITDASGKPVIDKFARLIERSSNPPQPDGRLLRSTRSFHSFIRNMAGLPNGTLQAQ